MISIPKAKLVRNGEAVWELSLLGANGAVVHTTTTDRRGAVFSVIRAMGMKPGEYSIRRIQTYNYVPAIENVTV